MFSDVTVNFNAKYNLSVMFSSLYMIRKDEGLVPHHHYAILANHLRNKEAVGS